MQAWLERELQGIKRCNKPQAAATHTDCALLISMSYLAILLYALMTLILHSSFNIHGSPMGKSNAAPDVWLTYMNKAMNWPTELFTVANNPG